MIRKAWKILRVWLKLYRFFRKKGDTRREALRGVLAIIRLRLFRLRNPLVKR